MSLSEKLIKIIPIFPTPVYAANLDRVFSKEEMLFIDKAKKDAHKNEGNISSVDTYVLNNPTFNVLKEEIMSHVNKYLNDIINPKNELNLYITQSWLNYTEENEFHHAHSHPNSIVSGVLYINADRNNDQIIFDKPKYPGIEIDSKNINEYNTNSVHFVVDVGNLLLFPSSLKHYVSYKKGSNTRISLAFNTFIKGKIGNKETKTELYL
jgi:uncharacterized protein (TIGR02466 family)